MHPAARPALTERLGRVLVVDDEADIRHLIRLILSKAGYEVVEAEDGREAVRTLNSGDNPLLVNLIVCDIRMPRVGGSEAIEYFRGQYPHIPVVVLTGYPDVDLAVALLRRGVANYLLKPVSREELLGVVDQTVLAQTAWQDEFTV